MEFLLLLFTGVCWTIVYLQSIYVGFKDKTYAMPFFALALNIAWEGLYSYIGLKSNIGSLQTWICIIWFLLDLVIVYTYFRFGKGEFSKYANVKFFIPVSVFIIFMSFIIQYSFFVEFHSLSSCYSAFIQNLIMSVLYINMFISRKGAKGQNLIIAIGKWVGTLSATILLGIIYGNQLVLVLGIFCSAFDIGYILYLLYSKILSICSTRIKK
jgi:hypothetical protein